MTARVSANTFCASVLFLLWRPPVAAQSNSPVDPQALISQLRGLHFPEDPSWWPPAPGWWVAVALVLLVLGWLFRRLRISRRDPSGSWQQSALSQHHVLLTEFNNGAPLNEVLAWSSVLMRRVALAKLPRHQSAGVQNDAWLQMLDKIGSTNQYSDGPGRLLLDHPYRQHSDVDHQQVADLLELMHNTISNTSGANCDV